MPVAQGISALTQTHQFHDASPVAVPAMIANIAERPGWVLLSDVKRPDADISAIRSSFYIILCSYLIPFLNMNCILPSGWMITLSVNETNV